MLPADVDFAGLNRILFQERLVTQTINNQGYGARSSTVNTGRLQPVQMRFSTMCAELPQGKAMKNKRGANYFIVWLFDQAEI